MKKNKKKIFIFVVLTVFFLSSVSTASAYILLGAKHHFIYGNVVPYKWGTYTDTPGKWRDAFLNANYAWNNGTSDVQWGYAPDNSYSIEQVYYYASPSQYGRTQLSSSNGYWTLAWAEINQYSLETVGEKSAIFKQSVACHEEGHSLGLDDNNNTATIMDQNRNREFIFNPQTDDINGVNQIY